MSPKKGTKPVRFFLRAGLLVFAASVFIPADAMAKKYCTCVAATGGWKSGIVHNYGTIASYADLDTSAPKKCSKGCSDRVSGKVDIANATALCASTGWVGGCVRGYGYIGSIGTNNPDGTAGKLNCNAPVAAVTQQKCPQGWLANTTNQDGGVAADGKCKRLACQPLSTPLPANGTPLGTWGFSWGNGIWQWGPSQTVVITPAKPGSGSWSTCP
jgi:hypothetical protein